jgi:hypothetical protein
VPMNVSTPLVVGAVGGIYGIGGGSILAPILIEAGRSLKDVAPATLLSTFLTSVVGVKTFVILATGITARSQSHNGTPRPGTSTYHLDHQPSEVVG